jgi:hypothetical protein
MSSRGKRRRRGGVERIGFEQEEERGENEGELVNKRK